ncbi:hypothetical protein LTR78_007450 [Recurvomyces mirabilis]|uniref:Uncharacterized protein n=1 Tax=Recurvomyces mirabilis TaxID=574656 RepID=A0AAE0TUD9_9PEZI|nr:hypothetical protein LTR78_007450 [Recurvomyces mirabilis]KAK5160041.1 hypothetical protein LTS14_002147 [Recurvomyces mirabilis]
MSQLANTDPCHETRANRRQFSTITPVNRFGLIRIQNHPQPVEPHPKREYKFSFFFDDDHDFLIFAYSGELDLSEYTSDWLIDHDLDLHFLRPIRNLVECVSGAMFETSRHHITFAIPPMRLRKRSPPALFVRDAHFGFRFPLGADDGDVELSCSNRDDILTLVRDWLDDLELDQQFLIPVRNVVEQMIEGIADNPRHEVVVLPSIDLYDEPRRIWSLARTQLTGRIEHNTPDGHQYAHEVFCSPRPARSTSTMRQISPGMFRDFNTGHFRQYVLHAMLMQFWGLLPARIVCVTLATCAQILHRYVEDCPCHSEDIGELEGLKLTLLKHLSQIIPCEDHLAPEKLHSRMRYLFEQLRCFLQTTGQSTEQVVRSARAEQQARRAAECVIRALDITSRNHSYAVGSWAWEQLLIPLSRPRLGVLEASFIGWPGNNRSNQDSRQGSRADEQAIHHTMDTTSTESSHWDALEEQATGNIEDPSTSRASHVMDGTSGKKRKTAFR